MEFDSNVNRTNTKSKKELERENGFLLSEKEQLEGEVPRLLNFLEQKKQLIDNQMPVVESFSNDNSKRPDHKKAWSQNNIAQSENRISETQLTTLYSLDINIAEVKMIKRQIFDKSKRIKKIKSECDQNDSLIRIINESDPENEKLVKEAERCISKTDFKDAYLLYAKQFPVHNDLKLFLKKIKKSKAESDILENDENQKILKNKFLLLGKYIVEYLEGVQIKCSHQERAKEKECLVQIPFSKSYVRFNLLIWLDSDPDLNNDQTSIFFKLEYEQIPLLQLKYEV